MLLTPNVSIIQTKLFAMVWLVQDRFRAMYRSLLNTYIQTILLNETCLRPTLVLISCNGWKQKTEYIVLLWK